MRFRLFSPLTRNSRGVVYVIHHRRYLFWDRLQWRQRRNNRKMNGRVRESERESHEWRAQPIFEPISLLILFGGNFESLFCQPVDWLLLVCCCLYNVMKFPSSVGWISPFSSSRLPYYASLTQTNKTHWQKQSTTCRRVLIYIFFWTVCRLMSVICRRRRNRIWMSAIMWKGKYIVIAK